MNEGLYENEEEDGDNIMNYGGHYVNEDVEEEKIPQGIPEEQLFSYNDNRSYGRLSDEYNEGAIVRFNPNGSATPSEAVRRCIEDNFNLSSASGKAINVHAGLDNSDTDLLKHVHQISEDDW